MSARFEQVLTERNRRWMKISGRGRERVERAVEAVDNLLA
jgi:hypothetical protein